MRPPAPNPNASRIRADLVQRTIISARLMRSGAAGQPGWDNDFRSLCPALRELQRLSESVLLVFLDCRLSGGRNAVSHFRHPALDDHSHAVRPPCTGGQARVGRSFSMRERTSTRLFPSHTRETSRRVPIAHRSVI